MGSARATWGVAHWHGLFAATSLLSAFLLFQLQPLIGKAILPWFGGGPGVWTTAMLFFQLVLLAGYGYAHLLPAHLSPRSQLALHGALLVGALLLLPIVPDPAFKPAPGDEPVGRILLVLTCTVGLPYFVLSTTGPLLQRWFSMLAPERSPYALYALSNLGSLLALLSYPPLFEALFGITTQANIWSAGFAVFALVVIACGLGTVRGARTGSARSEAALSSVPPPGVARYALWFTLALVPSAMLLATTNQLCIDVATVPFLWVAPLSVYLLSFIVCFGYPQLYRRGAFAVIWTLVSVALCALMMTPTVEHLLRQIAVGLGALAACAMVCHGELAQRRPDPRHLTGFYFAISAGGAAGGVLVGVIAPHVFHGYGELHLSVMGCYAVLLALMWMARRGATAGRLSLFVTAVGAVLSGAGLAADAVLAASGDVGSGRTLARSRNFYGVLRVSSVSDARILTHGRIWHGIQFSDPARRNEATLYYAAESGVGELLTSMPARPVKVGAVGLGVGTLARYGRAGDVYRFYEIDPDVVQMAGDHFTFMDDSAARVDVVLGDGRISLEREAPNDFDVLVLDAFSSDSVPAHLLTVEAFELYLRHLRGDGVLALHLSNRHLDLTRVVSAAAAQLGLACELRVSEADPERVVSHAVWALVSRTAHSVAAAKPHTGLPVLWTDGHNALFEVLLAR